MSGYSKINVTGSSHKSRSVDFSADMFSFPDQTPKQSKNKSSDESGKGEQFGVILGRSTSVSSVPGMKKALFSVRRSSSVSERYCRIHDQCNMEIGEETTDIDHVTVTVKKNNNHRGGKILRACKRLLRF